MVIVENHNCLYIYIYIYIYIIYIYIYTQQVLTLSQTTLSQLTVGHVVNLASNDVHHFDEVSVFLIIIHHFHLVYITVI